MDLSRVNLTVLKLCRTMAPGSGFSSELLYGIWAHETGNGTSGPWLRSNNPGGIKFAPAFFITSAWVGDTNGRDAGYPNWAISIAALVFFLRQGRYSSARGARLDLAIKRIGDAGYVEHVPGEPANWIQGVTLWSGLASGVSA